jgi:PadR family transcriptional regulator PadR
MTLATQSVLKVLLDDPSQARYGFEIAHEAGLATGSLYPILARLEHAGWLTSWWEDIPEAESGRPRRRYYRLTTDGAVMARDALARTLHRVTPKTWRPAAGSI